MLFPDCDVSDVSHVSPSTLPEPYLLKNSSLFNFLTRGISDRNKFVRRGKSAPEVPVLTGIIRKSVRSWARLDVEDVVSKVRRLVSWCSSIRLPRRKTCPLMVLPNEILVRIMGLAPPPSLYCLRQTSSLLMALFDQHDFKEFQGPVQPLSNHR
ncbi:hypothetical protein E4U41_005231 [Claviceps citrina]|nr:hypothetical protein E4U41_005231 [Claviceps citrina]